MHCILKRLSRLSVGNVCHHLAIPPDLWGLPFLKNKIFRKLLLFRALQGRQMELLEHRLKWHLAHFSKSRIRIKATGPVLELPEGLSARAVRVLPVGAAGSLSVQWAEVCASLLCRVGLPWRLCPAVRAPSLGAAGTSQPGRSVLRRISFWRKAVWEHQKELVTHKKSRGTGACQSSPWDREAGTGLSVTFVGSLRRGLGCCKAWGPSSFRHGDVKGSEESSETAWELPAKVTLRS